MATYENAKSSVRLNNEYSNEFDIKVGVHQGAVLSPLLFIIVMEALSREFKIGCPWELLYADDLVIMCDSLEELKQRILIWKANFESKGLRINMNKTKVLHSNHNTFRKVDPSEWPCGVCKKGVGSNSILCCGCKHWIHKRCSGIPGRIISDPSYLCKICNGEISDVEFHLDEVIIDDVQLEVLESFCYLGDVTGESGGSFDATTARICTAWKSFHCLLPVLTNKGISLQKRGYVYNACIRSVILYGSENGALNVDDVNRLEQADNAMIRWMCSVRLPDHIPTVDLRSRLGLQNIRDMLQQNRLRWFGHLYRMEDNVWPKNILTYEIDGRQPRGRPRKRWVDNVNSDLKQLRIDPALAKDRTGWRRAINPKYNMDGVQPSLTGNQGR